MSKTLWRSSRFSDLTGEGAKRVGGRWHSAGSPVVYMSETASGALLEHLAYLEVRLGDAPEHFPLIRIEAAGDAEPLTVNPAELLPFWEQRVESTREIGDNWLEAGEPLFLAVPSVLCPATWNWLLNPRHPGAGAVKIIETTAPSLDTRLLPRVRL